MPPIPVFPFILGCIWHIVCVWICNNVIKLWKGGNGYSWCKYLQFSNDIEAFSCVHERVSENARHKQGWNWISVTMLTQKKILLTSHYEMVLYCINPHTLSCLLNLHLVFSEIIMMMAAMLRMLMLFCASFF